MFRVPGDLARNRASESDARARVALVSAVRGARRGIFHGTTLVDLARADEPGETLQKRAAMGAAAAKIYKALGGALRDIDVSRDERIALGIALEPTKDMGQPDSQNDVYSAEEVRRAKESWDLAGRPMGIQHADAAGDRVQVLDSFILPSDAIINGAPVVAGSWLVAVHINDIDLWKKFRTGELTGFSIGGTAHRIPLDP